MDEVMLSQRNKNIFLIDGYKFFFINIYRKIANAGLVAKITVSHFLN